MFDADAQPEGRQACGIDFRELKLQYGEVILVRPEGLDFRLTTHFVGMESRSYLIVRLSPLGVDLAQVQPNLEKGNELKLFITCAGSLIAYRSRSMAFNATPYRHLYLAWPSQGEAFTLRRHDRFDCHLPARVESPGLCLSGMLLDISRGGCRASLDPPDGPDGPSLREGALVELRFSLLNPKRSDTVLCEVRNTGRAKGLLLLGLRFVDLTGPVRARLEAFLRFLERYRPLTRNARR